MPELPLAAVREARDADAGPITGRTHCRGVMIGIAAALILSFAGAFDTSVLPLLPRTAFWLIVMVSGALIGIGASTGVRSWGRFSDRLLLEGAVVSGLIAVPATLLAIGAAALFFGPQIVTVHRAPMLLGAVAVVTVAVTAINYVTAIREARPLETPPPPDAALAEASASPAPDAAISFRLAQRLPLRLRHAAILALEAEDHYVRVHTDAGSDLLLLRLTDAMAELDGMRGARTHRSWWVARDAIAEARRGDGRGELVLVNGIVVPVSRSALPPLQRDGWFADRPPD